MASKCFAARAGRYAAVNTPAFELVRGVLFPNVDSKLLAFELVRIGARVTM